MKALFKLVLYIFILIPWFNSVGYGNADSLTYSSSIYFLTASNSFQPHWQVANRYGIFDRSVKSEIVGLFGLSYENNFNDKLRLVSEVEFNLNNDSYFQQAYANLSYGALQLKLGKEEYTMGQYNEELSSGSLFVSNNARPIPKIGAGFYDYSPIPFLTNLFEFKGAFNLGVLDDDRSEFGGADKPLYQEKFLYLKSKFLPVNIHAGLNHSALFGGTTASGEKINVDFWATFFGRPSNSVGGGEAINVAGAHFGLYDFGLNWNIENSTFQLYYQIPFADDGGMQILKNGDKLIGLLIDFNNEKLVRSFIYEFINTRFQGGHGVPDAVFDGEVVDLLDIEDPDAFMLEQFDTITVGMTNHELKKYCEDELNYGYLYNGRDDYYNNYLYPVGQSYNNYSIGTSVLLSKKDMQSINPDFNADYEYYFVSNRIVAHHVAFEGRLSHNLTYRTKLTYSINYGSYAGANRGRYDWASKEDPDYYNSYYFKDGLKEVYSFLEFNYLPFKNENAIVTSSFAYDFGDMYHNFGILVGFRYSGAINLKKQTK